MAVVGRGSAIFDLSIPVSAASPEFWVGAAESLVCLAKCTALTPQSAPAAKLHRPTAFRPQGSTFKARWQFIDALFYFLQSPLRCDWNWRNTASTSANQRLPLCSFPTNQRAQHFLLQTLWAWQNLCRESEDGQDERSLEAEASTGDF